MTSGASWEFNCPQFVDFMNGEGSPKDDVFSGGTSPGLKDCKAVNLPKGNPFRPAPLYIRSRCEGSVNYTDSEKVVVQNQLSKRLSKSDGSIHFTMKTTKTTLHGNGAFARLERTVSESELRFKPKTGPTTPMCLKRTLVKTKNKKIKTTEELELEKIAQLQMQTKMHLRANELTMMRRRQKPGVIQKEVTKTDMKPRDTLLPPKEQKVIPKVNVPRKIRSPQVPRLDARAILTREIERMKVINPPNPLGDRISKPLHETNAWNKLNPKHLWAGKDVVNSLGEKSLVKSYDAHSGITLFASREKSAVAKSFIFPTKTKEFDSREKSAAAKSFVFPTRLNEFGIASNIKKWREGQLKSNTCQKSHMSSSLRIQAISGKENFASRSFFYPDGKMAQQPKLRTVNQVSKISKEI